MDIHFMHLPLDDMSALPAPAEQGGSRTILQTKGKRDGGSRDGNHRKDPGPR